MVRGQYIMYKTEERYADRQGNDKRKAGAGADGRRDRSCVPPYLPRARCGADRHRNGLGQGAVLQGQENTAAARARRGRASGGGADFRARAGNHGRGREAGARKVWMRYDRHQYGLSGAQDREQRGWIGPDERPGTGGRSHCGGRFCGRCAGDGQVPQGLG